MKVQEWVKENSGMDGECGNQVRFVRDILAGTIFQGMETDYDDRLGAIHVISTHFSKSTLLPVFQINFKNRDRELTFIMRNNLYNWKLSVISNLPVEADFTGLFATTTPLDPSYTGDPLASCYFEGFPEDKIFGYYYNNQEKFSAEIYGDYNLQTTIFLIMRDAGAIRPYVWHTMESHQKEMDKKRIRYEAKRDKQVE